jgi:hypothetical protein
LNECTELLLALSEDPSRCFPEVAQSAIAGLDRIGMRDPKSEADEWEPEQRRRPLGPQFLVNLLEALRRFKTEPCVTLRLRRSPGVPKPSVL